MAVEDTEEAGGSGGGEEQPPPIADAAIHADLALVPALELAETGWMRKEVFLPGIAGRVRVQFDNFSHDTGQQRGWCVCSDCPGCVRWRQCRGTQVLFCAEMYVWRMGSHREECDPEKGGVHLSWQPSEEDVAAVAEHLVMQSY